VRNLPRVQALAGLRVIDMATVFAGPGAARHLADFGADVVKVESPTGDGVRRMGWFPPEGGDSYTWKLLGRNKRAVVLDLKTDAGLDALLRLADSADVLVENFRPGTIERLGLGPDVLLARNPRLVVLRVTGFGQDGPYASKPGFATIAEAMSGFAAINGEPDGAPLLPPIALTDEVAALAGAFAVMVALRARDASGEGQVVDVNLLESMIQMMSALPSAAAHLDYEHPRLGSGIPYSVPRGTYRCGDGEWIAISGVGGLGHLAVQYAKVMGLHICAIDIDDSNVKTVGSQSLGGCFAKAAGSTRDNGYALWHRNLSQCLVRSDIHTSLSAIIAGVRQ